MRPIIPLLCFALLLAGCAPAPSTPYIPPTRLAPEPTATPQPTAVLLPTALPPTSTPPPPPPATPTPTCFNDLAFVADETVPDGMIFAPGERIDKAWRVRNSGGCHWDARYGLQWVGGDLMGADPGYSLYPALAGGEATLRIQFIAPFLPGTYQSAWQATAPDGSPFGERIYISIFVENPITPTP